MNKLRIQLADGERSCTVDASELQAWAKALLDDVLFESARQIDESRPADGAYACIGFSVSLDSDGTVIIRNRPETPSRS